MVETYRNYIGGEWVAAETGETFENRNPADTTDLIGRFQQSSSADAERAVAAAREAAADWAATPGPERGRLLREAARCIEDRADELRETLTREEGKTLDEAGEVVRAYDIFYYYAGKARDIGGDVKQSSSADRSVYTVKEPLGVAALVTPWNFPIAIPAWKLAPALATGNTVVFNPASAAPDVARKLVECLEEAGIPPGVVNLVTGPGSEVGDTFVTHEDVDVVSFTGSAEIGTLVYEQATADQKRVQCEMGGKNPTVVSDAGDLEVAVDVVGGGAFGLTGQACTACSRAIVYDGVYEEFVDGIVDYAESLEVGDGRSGADMGPHVSESELEGTLRYVEVAEQEGATLATGGNRLTGAAYDDGYFVEPTVFVDVEPDMRIANEEVFGPVLAVLRVDSFEEALDVANDVQYGLSASIVTNDHAEANRFIRDSETGVVKVNEKPGGVELHLPFGGYKRSSTNTYREQGDAAIDFYTSHKAVYQQF